MFFETLHNVTKHKVNFEPKFAFVILVIIISLVAKLHASSHSCHTTTKRSVVHGRRPTRHILHQSELGYIMPLHLKTVADIAKESQNLMWGYCSLCRNPIRRIIRRIERSESSRPTCASSIYEDQTVLPNFSIVALCIVVCGVVRICVCRTVSIVCMEFGTVLPLSPKILGKSCMREN